MQILQIFDKKDYTDDMPRLVREAVRAIIIQNGKIALVKSQAMGYYKFPGGGVESGESHIDTLIRETQEETGLQVIPDTIREFGMIKEIRKGMYDNELFEQNSYYYFADVSDHASGYNLDEYEALEGYHLEFVPLAEALCVNERLAEHQGPEFLCREAYVLRLLWQNRNKEPYKRSSFTYITPHDFTGDMQADIRALLYANNKQKTFDHVKSVAEANMEIARQYGLDEQICELCGYLHDISAVVTPDDMLAYAVHSGWYIDEAERKFPFLLHQRISKVIAIQVFDITDERILSAIECHSTLKSNPSGYDMALFVADKLSWDQEGQPPFYPIVKDALRDSLEAASLAYMEYIVDYKMILHPHQWFTEGAAYLRNQQRYSK